MWAILIAVLRDSACTRCLGERGEEVPRGGEVVGWDNSDSGKSFVRHDHWRGLLIEQDTFVVSLG